MCRRLDCNIPPRLEAEASVNITTTLLEMLNALN